MLAVSRYAPLAALLFLACSNSDEEMAPPPPPQSGADCNADSTACTFYHDFGLTTIKAGEERTSECYTYKLDNPTDLLINNVELSNDGAFHHSNWFYVPEKSYNTEESLVRCHDIGFSEITAALLGGVLFAQSTQSQIESQQFPPGAIVRVPAYSRIITSAHLLNAAAREVQTGLRLTLHTIPPSQKQIELYPFRLSYTDLHIPAMQHSEFTGECNLRKDSEILLGAPFYMKIYYVLPHFHANGEMFNLQLLGGPNTGKTLYDLRDGIGEAHGQSYNPPLDLSQADGLRFTCGFNNASSKEIRWGNGNGEMCVMLGFADSKARYDANVNNDKYVGDRQGTALHQGPCGIAVYPVEN